MHQMWNVLVEQEKNNLFKLFSVVFSLESTVKLIICNNNKNKNITNVPTKLMAQERN